MTRIKLLAALLIGSVYRNPEDEVIVSDTRARELIASGHADPAGDEGRAELPPGDPERFADLITPAPNPETPEGRESIATLERAVDARHDAAEARSKARRRDPAGRPASSADVATAGPSAPAVGPGLPVAAAPVVAAVKSPEAS